MRNLFNHFRSAAAVSVIGACLLITPSAFAQSDVAEEEGALTELVVTAQRRSEKLQDVPLSVDVVSGDKLNAINAGGGDVRAFAGRVPSLNIESSFGRTFPRFYIRGLGNTDFDLNASQPVSLVYDDVVLENPILKGFPVFDVARVEVLRGPQGTLFGRNTPAGIVKFDSVRPDASGGYVKASYGSFGSINAEGAVGGEISDQFAARISGQYQYRDNWIDNVATTTTTKDLEGYDDISARLQLQFKPTETMKLRVTGQIRDFDGTARVFRANIFNLGSNKLRGLSSATSDFKRNEVRTDGLNFQRLKSYNLASTFDWDLGPVTLTSVTSWWNGNYESRGDIDGGIAGTGPGFIPFSAQSRDDVPNLDQFTQELRFASNNTDGITYQAGLFYFREDLDIQSLNFGAPTDTTFNVIVNQRQNSKAYAAFGSVTVPIGEKLFLTGGARYNHDERKFRVGRFGFFGAVGTGTESVDEDNVTWDISARYAATDDVSVYARVAKGYRAPSIQGRALFAFGSVQGAVSKAKSETILSYEAGLKTELNNRLRFNLTGFAYTLNDAQLTAVGGAGNAASLLNVDKVDGYGLEAEFEARPVDALTFTAGIGVNSAKINDANAFIEQCGGAFPTCTATDPLRAGSTTIRSINGNQLPQAPKFTANWTARYAVPAGSGEFYAFTDWAYRSSINFFLYESREFNDDKMLEGGLRVGYKTDKFDIAGFVRNITDDVSAVGGIDFNNLTGFVNEPRIFGAEVGFKF
jgi:iron complex outermembrane recepter protein